MSLFLAVTLSNEDKLKLKKPLNYLQAHADCNRFEEISALHITMKKITTDDSQHGKVIDILKAWEHSYNHAKFTVDVKNFYKFPGGIEWMGINGSFPLYIIKHEIECVADEFAKNLNDYKDVFQKDEYSYTPHITVGFDVTEHNDMVRTFDSIPIVVSNIVLWGYDNKLNGVHMADTLYQCDLK
jgi:2'-5' RNA ligase